MSPHWRHLALDQRAGLVLCRHHDGHAAHSGDVGGRDGRGGQREGPWVRDDGGGASLLAVGCLWQRLGLRQLGVALRPGRGAPVGAVDPATRQRAAVAVTKVVWRGGAVALRWPVARRAVGGRDDGGGVGGRPLWVLLQLLVAVVVVEVVEMRHLLVVRAGRDGGQGAVLGDDVRAHAALGPGDALGGLSILPGGKHRNGTHIEDQKKEEESGRGAGFPTG